MIDVLQHKVRMCQASESAPLNQKRLPASQKQSYFAAPRVWPASHRLILSSAPCTCVVAKVTGSCVFATATHAPKRLDPASRSLQSSLHFQATKISQPAASDVQAKCNPTKTPRQLSMSCHDSEISIQDRLSVKD